MEHILTKLSRRYPQLLLPISDETRHSEAYKNAVLRGVELRGIPAFGLSKADTFEAVETPAGTVEVLCLAERADFEHCVRALAHRCEAAELPETMGASTVSGLINWEKIRAHQREYLSSGGEDWDSEFKLFTADRRNFRDTIILLSRGPYSALSAEDAGYERTEWLSLSLAIRKYHELAHFVSRNLFPDNKDAVRDEVLADMNGIIGALGHFDAGLEAGFLGVRDGAYVGGRLGNYVSPEELADAAGRVCEMLGFLEKNCAGEQQPYECLLRLEKERTFL